MGQDILLTHTNICENWMHLFPSLKTSLLWIACARSGQMSSASPHTCSAIGYLLLAPSSFVLRSSGNTRHMPAGSCVMIYWAWCQHRVPSWRTRAHGASAWPVNLKGTKIRNWSFLKITVRSLNVTANCFLLTPILTIDIRCETLARNDTVSILRASSVLYTLLYKGIYNVCSGPLWKNSSILLSLATASW